MIERLTSQLFDDLWSAWTRWDPDVRAKVPGANVATIPSRSLVAADEMASLGRDLKNTIAQVRRQADTVSHVDPTLDLSLSYAEWLGGEWTSAPLRAQFEFPVTPYVSAERTEAIVATLESYTFSGDYDVERYLELMHSYVGYVRQLRETLWRQSAEGTVIPAPAIEGTLAAVRASHATIIRHARPVEIKLQELNRASASRLGRAVESLINNEIAKAQTDLLDFLTGDYRAQAPQGVGMSQYSGGDEYYRSMVRTWTTTDLEPSEIHLIGLEQVDMLTQRLAQLPHSSEFATSTATSSSPLDAAGLLDHYHRVIDDVVARTSHLFEGKPATPWSIKRLDPVLEGSLTYGYYSPPVGGAAEGVYYFNGRHIDHRTLSSAPSLMAHELVPGHHWQIATQLENTDLPAFRREPVLYLNAYIEGWAEYAANLGWEVGVYEHAATARGRIENELFLAQRLVVDTAVNAMGWTLEQGIDYMAGTSTRSREQLRSEVLRYSTDLPGQALAYRLGLLEFERIGSGAGSAAGGANIRAFHDEVLRQGALPLPILAAHMQRWGATEGNRNELR